MLRSSRTSSHTLILAATCAFVLTACGRGKGAVSADDTRRRPDGVAIDPISSPPPPREHAATLDGLVTLRTPLGVDRAVSTIEELFRMIVTEDGDGLARLFTGDARILTAGSGGQAHDLPGYWQQRFRRLDYTRLAGEIVFRADEMEIFRADGTLETSPHPVIRLDALHENDVVIRLPILTPRLGQDRLFGEEMIFWLRRDNDRYRIYRILEDFQLS